MKACVVGDLGISIDPYWQLSDSLSQVRSDMNRQVRKDRSGAYGVRASPEVDDFEMIDAQSMLANTEYVMVDRPEGASDIEANDATNETSKSPPSVMEQSHFEILHSYATTHDPNEASYVKVNIAENKASGDLCLKDD